MKHNIFSICTTGLLVVSAISPFILYLFVVMSRLGYPFALEWMEGGSVEHVRRIVNGMPLYVEPSINFIPYIYPPLYFYLSALVATVTGIGFPVLRLVSFAASLGCFLLIFFLIKQETQSKLAGFVASSAFAGTFAVSGAWFDIGRIDSLFLCFLLTGIVVLRLRETLTSSIVAGGIFALAFFTKQTAGMIIPPLILYTLYTGKRRAAGFIGSLVLGIGGGIGWLNRIHHGWFWYYVFELPKSHLLAPRMLLFFWLRDILPTCAVMMGCGIFYFWQCGRSQRKQMVFYGMLALGLLGAAWMSRLHTGGYLNGLMPGHAALAILFGLGFHALRERELSLQAITGRTYIPMVYLVCVIQFFCLAYDPFDYIPSSSDRKAGEELIHRLERIPGEIYIPRHGYLAVLAGKSHFCQEMALDDILRSKATDRRSEQIRIKLKKELRQMYTEHWVQAIVLDYEDDEVVAPHYTRKIPVFQDSIVFWPVSGVKTRPEFIYTMP